MDLHFASWADGTEGSWTHRWSKADSNSRPRSRETVPLQRQPGHRVAIGEIGPMPRVVLTPKVGPAVRIRFPPALSQVRTCLAREFARLRIYPFGGEQGFREPRPHH